VSFPSAGDWTVRFTSILPPATLDRPQVIEEATTTSTVAGETTTTRPPDDLADAPTDTDDDGTPWVLIGLIALAILAGIGVAVVVRARSPGPPPSG
jgi:hypothetical protein